jgi:hypothetical protein
MSAILTVIVQQTIATYGSNRPAARSSRISRDLTSTVYEAWWLAPLGSVITEFESTVVIPDVPYNVTVGVSSHFKYL